MENCLLTIFKLWLVDVSTTREFVHHSLSHFYSCRPPVKDHIYIDYLGDEMSKMISSSFVIGTSGSITNSTSKTIHFDVSFGNSGVHCIYILHYEKKQSSFVYTNFL